MLSRAVAALVTILLAIVLAVVLSDAGGDPVRNLLGPDATRASVAHERAILGLDRPIVVQIVSEIGNVARGDFGTSLRYDRPNWQLIESRLPYSAELMGAALLLAIAIGVPLGVFAAVREESWIDRLSMAGALIGQSVPLYWLGMIAVLVFAVDLKWVPAGYAGGLSHLVLPAVVLATFSLGAIARLTRSSMIQVLDEPYVMAARAHGLHRGRVIFRHALRTAALPVVTMIGLQAGALLSGVVTIEVVFAWPGIGSLAVNAVSFRDFTLVQAIVIFGAIVFVAINFTVDVLYGVLDPRVRHSRA